MQQLTQRRTITGMLAAVTAAGALCVAAVDPAEARSNSREKAWRIGTYVGAAGTAAALATGKGTLGLIGAGATALSYSQWRREVKRRHRREGSHRRYRSYRYRRHR